MLNEKELLSIEELDELKKLVAERLVKRFVESGTGLMYQDPEYNKYTFKDESWVDCLCWLHICKAVCCRFPFALSRQDVEEGIIMWEFGSPYLIARDTDGYCVHLDQKTYTCTVREHRTVPCQGFDCRDNEKWKVWLDYEKGVINPELMDRVNEEVREVYAFQGNNLK